MPVFFDCEASSLDGYIIEIGCASVGEGGDIVSAAYLVRPPWNMRIRDAWSVRSEKLQAISLDRLRAHCKRPFKAKGDCQECCVRGRVDHHTLTNRSSNMMTNYVFGLAPFARRHFPFAHDLAQDENNNLVAASSVEKCPPDRTARGSLAFNASIARIRGVNGPSCRVRSRCPNGHPFPSRPGISCASQTRTYVRRASRKGL